MNNFGYLGLSFVCPFSFFRMDLLKCQINVICDMLTSISYIYLSPQICCMNVVAARLADGMFHALLNSHDGMFQALLISQGYFSSFYPSFSHLPGCKRFVYCRQCATHRKKHSGCGADYIKN